MIDALKVILAAVLVTAAVGGWCWGLDRISQAAWRAWSRRQYRSQINPVRRLRR